MAMIYELAPELAASRLGRVSLDNCNACTASFNGVSSSDVGIDVMHSDGTTVTRNNVSGSTTVDCRWDGSNVNALTNNNCGTQDPAGAFD